MSWRTKQNGGEGRIRTFEGLRRQIYSLIHLAALVPHRKIIKYFLELAEGIEPPTYSLQNYCSTSWATLAYPHSIRKWGKSKY